MANVFMDISNDVIFKRVFGKRSNKALLISILNEIVDELTIVDLEYLSPEMAGFDRDSKNSRMDLRVKTDTGYEVIIEMQVKDQKDFHDRAVYYASLPILEEVESGASLYTLSPRIMISFLHFSLKHDVNPHWDNEFRSRYALREFVTMEKLSDAMNLVFIELGRFRKSIDMLENDKERFYFCMKHMSEFTQMPREFEGNGVMEMLFETTAVESLSKPDKIKYISFMTTERDKRNQEAFALEKSREEGLSEGIEKGITIGVERGIEQGIERGIEKGRGEGRLEALSLVVENLRASGMSDEKIAEVTALSLEEIKNL